MRQKTHKTLPIVAAALVLSTVVAIDAMQTQSGTTPLLPSAPVLQSGASVSPAFEGWFDNPDGTHSFLIGYYNRNATTEVDIPIGPNNKFEPGDIDMGQPTHFLTRRRFGIFTVTVPKDFPKTQKIRWTLALNGVTTTIPFYMHTDYNLTPLKSQEESPNREFNTPPVLKFAEVGPTIFGPRSTGLKPTLSRTATVGAPMTLDFRADDDALYSTGGNGPLSGNRPIVVLDVTKYRGPGAVTVNTPVKLQTLKGGKPMEAYSGKGSTAVSFAEPGEYLLHVNGGDYSGNGGGGSGCCWTTAIVRVTVSGGEKLSGGQ
ncbi:MAG: hypothetical protein FJW27_09445 [Acidimicrobiia bacterium]|nr:hypothetical protein [Acidimicrobiia bacterium]